MHRSMNNLVSTKSYPFSSCILINNKIHLLMTLSMLSLGQNPVSNNLFTFFDMYGGVSLIVTSKVSSSGSSPMTELDSSSVNTGQGEPFAWVSVSSSTREMTSISFS